jgi:tetratricopeptide (TPR) repeat protein
MEEHDPLQHIYYISLPEEAERDIEGFTLDPSVPLPVELPDGEESLQLENLSWEMIVSAMLKIFAYNPDHEHIDYYGRFIRAVQPDIVDRMTQSGVVKAKNREYAIAEEIFLSLLNFAPEQESSFVNLALLYEDKAASYDELGDSERAEELRSKANYVYDRGAEHHPESASIHYSAGQFHLQQGNLNKAAEHFRSFLSCPDADERRSQVQKVLEEIESKSRDDLHFKEAYDYINMGQEQKAVESIDHFLQGNPEVWNAWFLRGWAKRRLGEYEEATRAFGESRRLAPDHVDTLNELAICKLELEQYDEAESLLREALEKEPENTKIISNMGILALRRGQTEQAEGFFRTVLEIDPEDPVAGRYLEETDRQS